MVVWEKALPEMTGNDRNFIHKKMFWSLPGGIMENTFAWVCFGYSPSSISISDMSTHLISNGNARKLWWQTNTLVSCLILTSYWHWMSETQVFWYLFVSSQRLVLFTSAQHADGVGQWHPWDLWAQDREIPTSHGNLRRRRQALIEGKWAEVFGKVSVALLMHKTRENVVNGQLAASTISTKHLIFF